VTLFLFVTAFHLLGFLYDFTYFIPSPPILITVLEKYQKLKISFPLLCTQKVRAIFGCPGARVLLPQEQTA